MTRIGTFWTRGRPVLGIVCIRETPHVVHHMPQDMRVLLDDEEQRPVAIR